MATVVLVHGGFHGGWCWRPTAERLRSSGHVVTTPTLTGLGERHHLAAAVTGPDTGVEDVVNHLVMEDLSDVVLVGHSLGGLIISGVADRVPERIRRLVYLDSVVVEGGSSWGDSAPPEVTAQRRAEVATVDGVDYWPDFPLEAFGIAADHPLAPWVRERITPLPFAYYDRPLTLAHPPGNGCPATYVVCTVPVFSSLAGSRDLARASGWVMRELPTGHDAMVLMPDELADLVHEEARRSEIRSVG